MQGMRLYQLIPAREVFVHAYRVAVCACVVCVAGVCTNVHMCMCECVWLYTRVTLHRAPVCVHGACVYSSVLCEVLKVYGVHILYVCVLVDNYAHTRRCAAACVQRCSRAL